MQRLFHGELYNKKGSDSGISLSEPIIFYRNTSVLSIFPLFCPSSSPLSSPALSSLPALVLSLALRHPEVGASIEQMTASARGAAGIVLQRFTGDLAARRQYSGFDLHPATNIGRDIIQFILTERRHRRNRGIVRRSVV